MPSRSSSSTTATIACCLGSKAAAGTGMCGGSITTVAVPPRTASRFSGSPASGNRRASRTAAGTSAIARPGGGGRRTIPSAPVSTTAIRVPERSGTRGIRALRAARRGGGDAERDEDAAGDVAPDVPGPAAAADAVGESGRDDGVGAVGERRDHDEDRPEQRGLKRDRAAVRVDELRQEREEEQRGLRVEDVDDRALPEQTAGRGFDRLLLVVLAAPCQAQQAEHDQVGSADEL